MKPNWKGREYPAIFESMAKVIADEPQPHWTTIEEAMRYAFRVGFEAAATASPTPDPASAKRT